jgi:hypothetical protein
MARSKSLPLICESGAAEDEILGVDNELVANLTSVQKWIITKITVKRELFPSRVFFDPAPA